MPLIAWIILTALAVKWAIIGYGGWLIWRHA